jgi:cyclic pyranopterin phosphate synthase
VNNDESQVPSPRLSHLSDTGSARMVDVSDKAETKRVATAVGFIRMNRDTLRLVTEHALPKGDVLTVARIAGVLAAKRTGELIPLCHPLPLTDIQIELTLQDTGISVQATASCIGRTGVEMEALTAVSVATLTLYDMCKAVDKRMIIENIHLVSKTGGKSGDFHFEDGV